MRNLERSTYRIGAKIGALRSLLSDEASAEEIERLQRAISTVVVHSDPVTTAPDEETAFVARIWLGILTRGWPTFVSPAVEQALLETIQPDAGLNVSRGGSAGELKWNLGVDPEADQTQVKQWLVDALMRSDPRLQLDWDLLGSMFGSDAERQFFKEFLVPGLGHAIGWVEPQRTLVSMVREDVAEHLTEERVDFALEIPQPGGGTLKVCFEVDGPQHRNPGQARIDTKRNQILQQHGWQVLRFPIEELKSNSRHFRAQIQAIRDKNIYPISAQDIKPSDKESTLEQELARLILAPQAVARIQWAVATALLKGVLTLNSHTWRVAVLERESTCAGIAIEDALLTLSHLCDLYDVPCKIETVEVFVEGDPGRQVPPHRLIRNGTSFPDLVVKPLSETTGIEIDLGVDVAVRAHQFMRYPPQATDLDNLSIRHKVITRTGSRANGCAVFPWVAPRKVSAVFRKHETLTYFLQVLFRKENFRDGQLPIIERALSREDVVGLLPTGAGKSITFQLPALLSSGLTMVIDPIKSLMQDQVDNLAAIGIHDAFLLNSDVSGAERTKLEWQFSSGEYRMIFISPERLQIKTFRDLLSDTMSRRPIAYLVVDEAHCVSEWGHDFRTAYLNIGRIAREYGGGSESRTPMIALTGTASESVLRDIQRELEVEGEESIVRPTSFARPELKFRIERTARSDKISTLLRLIEMSIPESLNVAPHDLVDGSSGGIVFCPHVNGQLGVLEVARAVAKMPRLGKHDSMPSWPEGAVIGLYSGEKPRALAMGETAWSEAKLRTQRAFKSGRTPILAATSAFGMGIDKPNIRFTVHYAMAKSVEAFAQEAGRAGRDRKDALCVVIHTDNFSSSNQINMKRDCLEPGITVIEALERAEESGWDQDDAELQIYLHSRSYSGLELEVAAVSALWEVELAPRIQGMERGATWLGPIDSSLKSIESRVVQVLEASSFQRDGHEEVDGPSRQSPETSLYDGNGGEIELRLPDIQKLIYRLSLLGLVEDYVVDYSALSAMYTVRIGCPSDETIAENLRAYVARYQNPVSTAKVNARFTGLVEGGECVISAAINTLCWFVYEEIERRRRQSIANMRQMLRDSKNGEDLAERLNQTLTSDIITKKVYSTDLADNPSEWKGLAETIINGDTAQRLHYQATRALEDRQGNPSLQLLAALGAFVAADSFSSGVSESYFRQAIRQVEPDGVLPSVIVDAFIDEVFRLDPNRGSDYLEQLLVDSGHLGFAQRLIAKTQNEEIRPSRSLIRKAATQILRDVEESLVTFMKE